MAATERRRPGVEPGPAHPAGALLAAALALPGVLPATAAAQTPPDTGIVQLKYLDYRDWQPGADRMAVKSPSLYALVPLPNQFALEGSLTYDAMSGASPLYYNTLSGASGKGVTDYRTGGDLKLTKYFDSYSVGVAGVASSERDFLSRGGVLDVRFWSDDRNRTWNVGFAGTNDRINPVNGIVENAPRNTLDFLVGVTQVLSADAIVQSNLTYSTGHGYYNDPYKVFDTRPGTRQVFAWLTRYNRHFAQSDGVLRLGYRYLHDSWGANSNMVEAGWAQPLPYGFVVTPNLRYYEQNAASFWHDPPIAGYVPGALFTADTRLSAFGALTAGLFVTKTVADGWAVNFRVEFYRQESGWRPGGGSPGIDPFSARWMIFGVDKTF